MNSDQQRGLLDLLARCEDDEAAAQREFANRSFLNTVSQAVWKTLVKNGAAGSFANEDIAALARVCVWEVYRQRELLVHRRSDFRHSLIEFAMAFTAAYLRQPRSRP